MTQPAGNADRSGNGDFREFQQEGNMKTRNIQSARFFLPVVAWIAGSACIISIPAGPTSTPQVAGITQTAGTKLPATPTISPTMESILTLTPTQTPTAEPTFTATTAPVTMTAGQSLSCAKGPHWILYEWVASIAEGETVTLLAKAAPEWEEYYYARKSNGTECWAFGGSSTKSGDLSSLPVKEAPPLPEVVYTIENKTGLDVAVVFIRGKDETVWGANRLSAVMVPGETFSLTLTAGFYDVKILDEGFGTLYEEHDRPIGSDPAYRSTLLDDEYKFYVQNNHPFDVCTFSFRPHGGATWTVLHSAADGHVTTGAKAWFKLVPGFYDVAVYRCTGPLAGVMTTHYVGPAIEGFNIP
jgi:hypothetical protein